MSLFFFWARYQTKILTWNIFKKNFLCCSLGTESSDLLNRFRWKKPTERPSPARGPAFDIEILEECRSKCSCRRSAEPPLASGMGYCEIARNQSISIPRRWRPALDKWPHWTWTLKTPRREALCDPYKWDSSPWSAGLGEKEYRRTKSRRHSVMHFSTVRVR